MNSTRQAPVLQKAIRVGVTGHRDLGAYDREALIARLKSVLAAIKDAAERCPDPPGCESRGAIAAAALSPLAAGSDQLVAELALELGYKLYAPLPLPREKYVADFRDNPEAEARFSTLLGRAEAVFELADDDNRPAAYQAVGRFVIEHSDVLIAIWDGEEAKGPGGTAQIVAEAVSADRLVVVVAPRPEDCRIANAISATNQPLEKQIEGHIRRLLAPWLRTGAPAGDAADLADMSTSRASHLADQLRDYAAFCREKPLHARWLWKLGAARVWSAIWPAFIGLFKARVQLAATTGKPRARLTRPTTCGPTNWQPTMPLCIAAPS